MPFHQLVIELPGAELDRVEDACVGSAPSPFRCSTRATSRCSSRGPARRRSGSPCACVRCSRVRGSATRRRNDRGRARARAGATSPSSMSRIASGSANGSRTSDRCASAGGCGSCLPASSPKAMPTPRCLELDPGLAFGTGTHRDDCALPRMARRARSQGGERCSTTAAAPASSRSLRSSSAPRLRLHSTSIRRRSSPRARTPSRTALGGKITVAERAERIAGPFDIVLANILAGPLIELAPRLAPMARAGGALVLAGLLERQAGRGSAGLSAVV